MNDPLAPSGDVAPEARQDRPQARDRWQLAERCLHVLALAALAVAQPLLDLLARHAEFFVAHRFTRADVGLLLVVLLILVPLPVVVLELVVSRAPRRAADLVHGLIVAGFAALFGMLTLKRSGLASAEMTLLIAAGAGALLAMLYLRAWWLRFFVSVLAVSLVAITTAFLASPQIRKLVSVRKASFHDLPSVASTAPIVFIIFDEFPTSVLLDAEGEINPYRYPNLANLARTSSWFPNAVSAAEISEAAIPAIVTGGYPEDGRLPAFEDYPRNLFTLFGGDYDVWAREPMSAMCPPELNRLRDETTRGDRLRGVASDLAIVYQHLVLPEPWTAHLPAIDAAWRDFATVDPAAGEATGPKAKKKSFFAMAVEAARLDRRQEFAALRGAIQPGSPGLYFLHVLLPHRPWEFTPEGFRYDGTSIPGLKGGDWLDRQHLSQQAYQRLIAQTQFLDAEVGRLVRRLEETGLFDRSLVVLVGDHGASFRPGDTRRLISDTNGHDIMPVPLLIKRPGQREGERFEHPVGIVDVLPTVLDALDVEPPWELEGRSGFDPASRELRFVTKQRGTRDVDPTVHLEKYATVRWKLEHFGDGADPLDLYRPGPDGDLVGRPATELIGRGRGPWVASIKDLERFGQVNLGDGIPAFIVGSVAGGAETEPCCRLAVALNGTIYAVTRTHTDTGRRRQFSVLLPYQGLREGPNRVEVYRLLDSAPAGEEPQQGASAPGVEAHRMRLRSY